MWGLAGSDLPAAGFSLIFVLLGYSLAATVKTARAEGSVLNPLKEAVNVLWELGLRMHLVILLVGLWIFIRTTEARDIWLESAFGMSIGWGNWLQIDSPYNYFSPDSRLSPFVHLWVVSVAIQLALLMLVVGFLVTALRVEVPISIRRLVTFGLFIGAGYLLFVNSDTFVETTSFFLSTTNWVWALLIGVALGSLSLRIPDSKANATAADIVFFAVLGLLILGLLEFSLIGSLLTYVIVLLPIVLVLFSRNETLNYRFLTSPWMERLSHISFAAFLWHWPLAQIWKTELGTEVLATIQIFAILIASYVLGFITTLVFDFITEKLSSGGLKAYSLKVISLAVVPVSLFVLQSPSSSDVTPNPTESITFSPALSEVASDVPEYLSNPDCTKDSTTCIYGDADSTTHVVLYGSSLSGNWQPALAQIAVEEKWKLEVRINPDCPSLESTKECDAWLKKTGRYLLSVKPDLVISNFSVIGSGTTPNPGGGPTRPTPEKEFLNDEIRNWDRFIEAGIRVLALRGPSIFGEDPIECLQTAKDFRIDCAISRSRAYLSSEEIRRYLGMTKQDIAILDLTDQFCSGDTCLLATEAGTVIYRDSTHITKTFSLEIVSSMKPTIVKVLSEELFIRPAGCLPNDPREQCQNPNL